MRYKLNKDIDEITPCEDVRGAGMFCIDNSHAIWEFLENLVELPPLCMPVMRCRYYHSTWFPISIIEFCGRPDCNEETIWIAFVKESKTEEILLRYNQRLV